MYTAICYKLPLLIGLKYMLKTHFHDLIIMQGLAVKIKAVSALGLVPVNMVNRGKSWE